MNRKIYKIYKNSKVFKFNTLFTSTGVEFRNTSSYTLFISKTKNI